MTSREREREYVTAHEFARFEELFEESPEYDALFRARLKRFSYQWHNRLGCEERVYIPPITLDDHGEVQHIRARLFYPLNEFESERGHYKTLHGTDVFILRDDTFKIFQIAQRQSDEDTDCRYALPFHPQDQALMFVISADPKRADEDGKEEPQWLFTLYYLAPYWISLDRGFWLRGWWHDDKASAPSCCADDAAGNLELDLDAMRHHLGTNLYRSRTTTPFLRYTPPRTLGPTRMLAPTCSYCSYCEGG
jgi:hypothetical protein